MIQIPNSSSCNSVCSLMFRIDSNSSYVLVIIEHWWKSNRRQLIVWTFLCAICGKGRETHRKTIDSPHNFLRLWSVNVIICSVVFRVDKFQFVNVDLLKSSQHQMFDRTLSAIFGETTKTHREQTPRTSVDDPDSIVLISMFKLLLCLGYEKQWWKIQSMSIDWHNLPARGFWGNTQNPPQNSKTAYQLPPIEIRQCNQCSLVFR